MICASYFRTHDSTEMVQGTWTDKPEHVASINACLAKYFSSRVNNFHYSHNLITIFKINKK